MDNLALIPLFKAAFETIYMVFISTFLSALVGGGLGIFLFLTRPHQVFEHTTTHHVLGFLVNATRSIPFVILMISILPLTRLIAGTTIGMNATIIPLALSAIPFYARICEGALAQVPHGLIEAADALGVSTGQLIYKVLLPESLPALIRGLTLTIIALIGYSAMAGVMGGGGLGELAINYGYQRFNVTVTLETVVLLIIIVQLVQWGGDFLAKKRLFKPIIWGSIFLGIVCLLSQVHFPAPEQDAVLRLGVMSGWSEEVMAVAQQEAKTRYHLDLKVVTFQDYVLPNTALVNHNIDANIFQHVPYLEAQMKAGGYRLAVAGKTFVYPMGFYSRKIKSLAALKNGATVVLPSDPSNEGRALLLLQKGGLITLAPYVSSLATLKDITQNPKNLQFQSLDAAQAARVLEDADLVAVTNDYIQGANLTVKQALLKEGADSLYANVIVVNPEDKGSPKIQALVDIMHSKPVVDATLSIFPDGAAIKGWK